MVVGFNTQPPEGGWAELGKSRFWYPCFNTQPPEGGWLGFLAVMVAAPLFQHTAARRRLVGRCFGRNRCQSFNTQPPEGGWIDTGLRTDGNPEFQHTAARRRLVPRISSATDFIDVSTHSRPKAAGWLRSQSSSYGSVSTHSRPKAAGLGLKIRATLSLCFNTQPPEGGWFIFRLLYRYRRVSTHSRPKAAGKKK